MDLVFAKKPDPGLCTSNEGRFDIFPILYMLPVDSQHAEHIWLVDHPVQQSQLPQLALHQQYLYISYRFFFGKLFISISYLTIGNPFTLVIS